MNKLSKEKQTQLIGVIFGTIVALGLIYFFLIDGLNTSLHKAVKTTEETRANTDKAEKLLKNRAAIEQDLTRDRADLAAIQEGMAPGDKYAWFVPLLTKFADPYKDLAISKVDQEKIKEVEMLANFPYRAAVFHVVITTFYVDAGRFIADFDNRYPYFQIQNLEILPTTNPTED
jgi:hypothetical protein